MKSFVRSGLTVLATLSVSLLCLASAGGRGVAAAPVRGDFDCSGTSDAVDTLKLVDYFAGITTPQTEPCVDIGLQDVSGPVGDANCDDDLDQADIIVDLRLVAGLYVAPCPDPIAVTVSLDESTKVTDTIAESGGVLSTIAADGTVYTLTFPPYAVAGAQQVSITPITRVQGVAFDGGYVAGVKLEPDGLVLWQPAILKIEPPSPIADGNAITFGYDGDGQDFHLVPLKPGASGIEIMVTHFSGTGVGSGSAGNAAGVAQHVPANPNSQLSHQIGQLDPNSPSFDAEATTIMANHYNNVVRPALQAAATNADAFDAALEQFLHWWYLAEVGIGDVDAQVAAGWQLVEAAALNAVNDAHDKCVTNHDLTKAARIAHLGYLGEAGLIPNMDLETVFPALEGCLHFQLRIHSIIVVDDMSTEVVGTAALVLQRDFTIEGSDAIHYTDFVPPQSEGCTVTGTTHGSTMFGRSLIPGAVLAPTSSRLTLIFNPGTPTEHVHIVCPDGPTIDQDLAGWAGTFLLFHAAEIKPAIGTLFTMENWTPGQGEIYAKKEYQNANEGAAEITVFTIRHTPH